MWQISSKISNLQLVVCGLVVSGYRRGQRTCHRGQDCSNEECRVELDTAAIGGAGEIRLIIWVTRLGSSGSGDTWILFRQLVRCLGQ